MAGDDPYLPKVAVSARITQNTRLNVSLSYGLWQSPPEGIQTMTTNEFNHIVESLNGLSPEQMRQLRRELDGKLATAATKQPAGNDLGSIGAGYEWRVLYCGGAARTSNAPMCRILV